MPRAYENTHQIARNRQRHTSTRSVRIADSTLRKRGLLSGEEKTIWSEKGSMMFVPFSVHEGRYINPNDNRRGLW